MKRALIANRGEIALRSIRACRKVNPETAEILNVARARLALDQFRAQGITTLFDLHRQLLNASRFYRSFGAHPVVGRA